MKIGILPARHMVTAIVSLVALAALIIVIYSNTVSSDVPALTPGSALKLVKAAHAYTYSLRAAGKPVPASIGVTNLVALNYLKPADVAAFEGLDVTVTLLVTNNSPNPVLLRIRQPDGGETVVRENGQTQQIPAGGFEAP
jgi:hypothetical protein